MAAKSRTSHLKTKNQRRKALLALRKEGLKKEGKVYEDATKKLRRKEIAAKGIVAVDTAIGVATGTAVAKTAAKAAAAKAAKTVAAKLAAKKRADAAKALTSPSRRKNVREKLHANRKAATPKTQKQRPHARSGDEYHGNLQRKEREQLELKEWRMEAEMPQTPKVKRSTSRARQSQEKRKEKNYERKSKVASKKAETDRPFPKKKK